MDDSRPTRIAHRLGFAAALLLAATIREGSAAVVNQAIIWLPTGVAVAGMWRLGAGAWWVVAATTFAQRLLLGYEWSVAIPACAGSTAEALLGLWVLRRLGFVGTMARLRDVGALLVMAALAPIGSIFFSWIGRSIVWADPNMPFYSGWGGWWRMNALGAMTVVPAALSWLALPRRAFTPRRLAAIAAGLIGFVALVLGALLVVPRGAVGVLWLYLLLTGVVLYAAGRYEMRGATATGALAALLVAAETAAGRGPFLGVPAADRHTMVQLFELALVTLPPAFGALVAERRAAIARGARSDQMRRSIQAVLPDITYRLRRDGVVLDVCVPPGVPLPVDARAVVGRSAYVAFECPRPEELRDVVERTFAEREPVTFEYACEQEGRRRIREARCVAYGDDEMLAVVRDITERKWTEATTALEARVLGLVANGRPPVEVFAEIVAGLERLSPGGRCSILVLDGRRMHVAMAPSLPAAFNAAVEGVEIGPTVGSCGAAAHLGRTVVVHDIATDALWAPYREFALEHGLRACWSVPIRDSHGAVLGTSAVYHGEPRTPEAHELALAERAASLAGIALEREQRREELRRTEELLASINQNVQEGLFRADGALRLRYANLAMARLFGAGSPGTLLGRSLSEAIEDPARLRELTRTMSEQGQWLNEEVRFRREDGTTFWGLLSGAAVRDETGAVLHHDGAIADVTARKALEEQFRQSQKMEAVGKLAGGVAHDFNNLLTVILGHAEALQADAPAGSPARAHAERVLDAAGRASGLTRQLLAYSRQQVLSPCELELSAVVDHMSGMLRRLIGEDVRLIVRHCSGACWVRVDPSQIEQVLLNLAVNARDAMHDGGTMTIETSCTPAGASGPRRVLLGVRDTGIGMLPDVRARAFDPFYTTKPLGKGTGLGLSTVQGIVHQSGGAVWIDSEPGVGTTVWVGLPACDPPAATASAPAVEVSEAPDGTVLVVEDESAVRALVCRLLERNGLRVLEAGDGIEGLEAARAHDGPIDLVVTDVVMPRLGGREMAAEMLALRPDASFLFLSGYADDARAADDLAGAAGEFLPKPFTPEQLLDRVRARLSTPRPLASAE